MDQNVADILNTSQFSYEGTFEDQINEIFQVIRLTRQEVEDMQILLDDLNQSFNEVWPGTNVLPFGSIVTGLGIKTSDADCYVNVPSWMVNSEKPIVCQAKYILMKRRDIFDRLLAIIHAKIPIVKFFHIPTNRQCDISFAGSMGVQNSKLIAYLLRLDERILQLSILIKYWSKVHKLTGTNLLPNYCLTMLVVFFMQQMHMLPPICELQRAPVLYIGGWNAAFSEEPYANKNTDTLYQLVGGFFKYYNAFKFSDFIISPYVGHPVAKRLFAQLESVPQIFTNYNQLVSSGESKPLRLDTYMVIQDPIEHSRNCAVPVTLKMGKTIRAYISMAVNYYEQNNDRDFLKQLLDTSKEIEGFTKRRGKKSKRKPNKPKQTLVGVQKQNNSAKNHTFFYRSKPRFFKRPRLELGIKGNNM